MRRAAVLAVLSACPLVRLSAQTISVVASSAFRPTAVLGPHVRYILAADSATGLLVVRDLAVPPVVFGTVRIEGVTPGAREPETRSFEDTVRFEPDGRVVLLRADERGRAPISVEVVGARGAAGGRLVIHAPRWPLARVLLVTFTPADIYELGGTVGFAVRDRIRVDDRTLIAYLSDSSAGPTTVAVGFGRGVSGRINSDAADVILRRDFGGEEGRERRRVGALTLAIEPAVDEAGDAHADVIFGVGNSEEEAAQAARAAGMEPAAAPRPAALRVQTPSADVDVALRHVLGAAGWQLDWDVIGGARTLPATAMRPALRSADAWRAAPIALARGDSAAVCGSYRVLRGGVAASAPAHSEVALRLSARGRYLGASDAATGGADAGTVLLGYACYRATRNTAWLRAELPALEAASSRAARDLADPNLPQMLRRLGEIEDELARISGGLRVSKGDSLRALASELDASRSGVTPAEAWRTVELLARRVVGRDYGRAAGSGDPGGLSLAAAGDYVDALTRGLFGIDEHLDHVDISPRLEGVADNQGWELDGWLLGTGDTLDVAYRGADQSARIRLAAAHGWRLFLRLPWLSQTSCITARRGNETERLALVPLADRAGYIDVRATFDPADIRISAAGCR